MNSVIITGCAGLLGSHFSRHLLNKGYRVVGMDNLSGGYKDFLPDHENFEFQELYLESNPKRINETFRREEPLTCYHFAAYAAEGLSPFIRHFNYTNNVLASISIVNACINSDCKLVFTSSMAVYGNQIPPFTEEMAPVPIDPYGIAKYTVEMDIRQAKHQFGLRYNIIRPHNVLGIYQNIWDRYRNVIGIFIRRVLDREPMLIYGDGEQTRAFSDIKYYMEPFEKLIDDTYNGHTFNIGADKNWTINEVARVVGEVASKYGHKATTENVEARHEAKHAYCDHAKAKDPKGLNFTDHTDLEKLIDEMFGWALRQPRRKMKSMEYEVKKGIYDYWK